MASMIRDYVAFCKGVQITVRARESRRFFLRFGARMIDLQCS